MSSYLGSWKRYSRRARRRRTPGGSCYTAVATKRWRSKGEILRHHRWDSQTVIAEARRDYVFPRKLSLDGEDKKRVWPRAVSPCVSTVAWVDILQGKPKWQCACFGRERTLPGFLPGRHACTPSSTVSRTPFDTNAYVDAGTDDNDKESLMGPGRGCRNPCRRSS